jgi:lipopolysaccharide export system protein LptA
MKKKIFLKIALILSLIIIICFIYFEYFKEDKNKLSKPVNPTSEIEEEAVYNSNIIKDINYTSRDLKGNEYILVAKEGEIDLDNSDIIFLTDVTAYIKLVKNSELIVITSNYGKYNTINYDTIFSKNVKIDYVDNIITGDYLDFSMMKNLLIVSRNVVYKNLENTMKADVIELDTTTKDTKIFMYNSDEQVNVTNIK